MSAFSFICHGNMGMIKRVVLQVLGVGEGVGKEGIDALVWHDGHSGERCG